MPFLLTACLRKQRKRNALFTAYLLRRLPLIGFVKRRHYPYKSSYSPYVNIHTLREIVILASRRIEVGDPIGKDLRSLHAAKHRAPSGKGFSTMSDYLIRRYASHCVRVLIQAQRASRSWIPPEYQEEMARSYKVRSGNGKAFCNSGKDHKGYPRGPQGDFVPTQRGLQSRFRHSVSRP